MLIYRKTSSTLQKKYELYKCILLSYHNDILISGVTITSGTNTPSENYPQGQYPPPPEDNYPQGHPKINFSKSVFIKDQLIIMVDPGGNFPGGGCLDTAWPKPVGNNEALCYIFKWKYLLLHIFYFSFVTTVLGAIFVTATANQFPSYWNHVLVLFYFIV